MASNSKEEQGKEGRESGSVKRSTAKTREVPGLREILEIALDRNNFSLSKARGDKM